LTEQINQTKRAKLINKIVTDAVLLSVFIVIGAHGS